MSVPSRPTMSRTHARTAPADRLQFSSAVSQDAWLNRVNRAARSRGGRARDAPCLAGIAGAFEVHSPDAWRVRRLCAAPRDDRSVLQTDGFVLDRPQDAIGQPPAIAPRPPLVRRRADHAPPGAGIRSHFIEERELACAQLEENRIPRRESPPVVLHACRHFYRWVHLPLTRRDSQMPTSSAPSRVPPNQAATRPLRVSTMVDACALANGADSKMNSTTSGSTAFTADRRCDEHPRQRTQTKQTEA